MTKPTRHKATEHIAEAWSHIEDGNTRACLMELDKAMQLLRPAPATPSAPPVKPDWSGAKPARYGRAPIPVESESDWWPDSAAAAEALKVTTGHVRNICNGNHSCDTAAGVRVWYSKFKTRGGWAMAREMASRKAGAA